VLFVHAIDESGIRSVRHL